MGDASEGAIGGLNSWKIDNVSPTQQLGALQSGHGQYIALVRVFLGATVAQNLQRATELNACVCVPCFRFWRIGIFYGEHAIYYCVYFGGLVFFFFDTPITRGLSTGIIHDASSAENPGLEPRHVTMIPLSYYCTCACPSNLERRKR